MTWRKLELRELEAGWIGSPTSCVPLTWSATSNAHIWNVQDIDPSTQVMHESRPLFDTPVVPGTCLAVV